MRQEVRRTIRSLLYKDKKRMMGQCKDCRIRMIRGSEVGFILTGSLNKKGHLRGSQVSDVSRQRLLTRTRNEEQRFAYFRGGY